MSAGYKYKVKGDDTTYVENDFFFDKETKCSRTKG